jgi:hypothetical protein
MELYDRAGRVLIDEARAAGRQNPLPD